MKRRPYKVYRRRYVARDGTKRRTRTYYVRFCLNGRTHRKSLGCRDRRAAELLAAQMYQREELRRAGAVDPFEEQRVRPLRKHIDDFEITLRARGVVDQYVTDRLSCLRAYVESSGATSLGDLDAVSASAWLNEVKASGLAARTVNRRYQALRQFGRWLQRNRRLAFDPFESLSPLNEAEDRRRVRRALTPDEAARLIHAARSRPLEAAQEARKLSGVSDAEARRLAALGAARALLYAVALGTGLRRGELKRLAWADVDLDAGRITVRASSAKSRREQTVPLRSDLADALRQHHGDARPTDAVFPGTVFPNLRTFKRDLSAAGIIRRELVERTGSNGKPLRRREVFDTKDEEGRVVDFHSLRYTFVTGLAASGVHPRVAQALARHAKIDLTMAVYTDLTLLDLRGAVEGLPTVPTVAPMLCQEAADRCPSLPEDEDGATDTEGAATEAPDSSKVQRAAEKSGGRYWTRTSDPQLVELVL